VTSMNDWEKKVLASPGAAERVAQIEHELRLAAGLTRLREQAGLSQRELAKRLGVRQPRIAAIERSRNVTFDVLERYVGALGGQLELAVVKGGTKIPLLTSHREPAPAKKTSAKRTPAKQTATKATSAKRTPTRKTRTKRAPAAKATPAKRTPRRKNGQPA
jgi:transcriptional regulator with XRE-family HTH domain